MMAIRKIKKELGITNKDIAKFFGYKTKESYFHATRRKNIEQGIVSLYELIKDSGQKIDCR